MEEFLEFSLGSSVRTPQVQLNIGEGARGLGADHKSSTLTTGETQNVGVNHICFQAWRPLSTKTKACPNQLGNVYTPSLNVRHCWTPNPIMNTLRPKRWDLESSLGQTLAVLALVVAGASALSQEYCSNENTGSDYSAGTYTQLVLESTSQLTASLSSVKQLPIQWSMLNNLLWLCVCSRARNKLLVLELHSSFAVFN